MENSFKNKYNDEKKQLAMDDFDKSKKQITVEKTGVKN